MEFSEMEQSIIKNSMLRKSHKEIAWILDVDVTDIAQFIESITIGTDIVTLQMQRDRSKKPAKPKSQRQPSKSKILAEQRKKEKAIELKHRNEIEKQRHEQRSRARQPAFKTKQVDYSQLISVKIDRKTTIYAKPGEDVSELKAKFIEKYGTKITTN
jgi:membrane protein involved in colicin uptake